MDTPSYDGNGWSKYEKMVLYRLDSMDKVTKELAEKVQTNFITVTSKLDTLTMAVTVLKTKAGIFGALGGFVGGAFIAWLSAR